MILVATAFAFAASLAAAWNVVPCDPAPTAKRTYADTEVTKALVEHFVGVYGAASGPFRTIADGMKAGAYTYEVLRVADWTPSRCADNGNGGDSYYLVVIRDGSKKEVARASLSDTGRFRTLALPDSHVRPIEPIAAAQARLAARAIHARDPQYVTTWGTLACHALRPCVASRNASGIYIVQDDELWLLPTGGRIRSLRTKSTTPLKSDERLVSLGADAMVVAKKVR